MCLYRVHTHHPPGSLKGQKREQKDQHEFFHYGKLYQFYSVSFWARARR
ncbi:hypothetical protein ECAE60S_01207 [Eoetvoesiella caeni]